MKSLPPKILQRRLMENMHEGKYTVDGLYFVYTQMMSLQLDLSYKIQSRNQFRDTLTRWSNVEGSWLIREGNCGKAIYHKWICHRSCMTRKQLGLTVKRALERLIPWRV